MGEPVFARETQYNFLTSIFAKSALLVPGAVLVWGPSACGKSMVVKKAIEDSEIKHVAFVSGREVICGVRQFLATIVKQLFNEFEAVNVEDVTCETTTDFVNKLSELKLTAKVGSIKFVLVVEDTETLRGENGELIEVLSRLQDYVQFNICVLFVSTLPFSSYCPLLDVKSMVVLNFPQYNKEEITAILLRHAPSGCNLELYSFHVKMTVSVFYVTCRDIRKLQRLAVLNFERFVRPFRDESCTITQKKMHELWMALQPKLMQDFRTLKANIVPAHDDKDDAPKGKMKEHKNKHFHCFPKYVKYLLVSAYLATHNPPSSDKRFFVKSYLGKKRRRAHENYETQKSYDPQAFTLNRLLAIYEFLTDYSMPFNQLMLGQITHLCQLDLLESMTSSMCPLDDPKYKCLASFDFIETVARSIDIDIKRYLYQYV